MILLLTVMQLCPTWHVW